MDRYPLTTPQQNIWNLQKFYSDTAIANLCGAVFFPERREDEGLRRAVLAFIRSQSGLRLRFSEGEKPTQYVSEEVAEDIPLLAFDTMEAFENYAKSFAETSIGLTERAMYRFAVVTVDGKSGVLAALSHLVADAWTFGLMAGRIDEAYRRWSRGEDCALPPGDYADFICAQEQYRKTGRYQRDRAYWREKYAARPQDSPVKLRPASSGDIAAERLTWQLPAALERRLGDFCRTFSLTPAVVFETAVVLYLAKVNGENDSVTIGVPVLNRSGRREKQTAGMFVSTMPLTVNVDREMTGVELAGRIAESHMELFRHQKYPYSEILKTLRERADVSGNLYDVMVSYQNAKTGIDAGTKWYGSGYSEIPLAMHINNRDGGGSHTVHLDYQTAVFGKREAQYLLGRLAYLLEQLAEDGERRIAGFSILPGQECQRLLGDFNDTYADYPRDKCVHELFAEQARRTPDKVALVFEEREFTYRQLDEMSNSLALFLREQGVGRNDVVPIIARRSWHVVAAMLGVLKAGGAYLPVDPDYPAERIAYMLEEAGCRIALCYGYAGELSLPCYFLEKINYGQNIQSVKNINLSSDACYNIFTSGSTGRPKGAIIAHYNLNNYRQKSAYMTCVCKTKKILSISNITFDMFGNEIWSALLNGLEVVLVSEKDINRPQKLADIIEDNKIDLMISTPTRFLAYCANKTFRRSLVSLKCLVFGGESFKSDLYSIIKKYSEQCTLINGYGPTETTICSTYGLVDKPTCITIGRPIANTQIYILDADGSPLPIGVAGELCIAGDGVGLGYLNRPELTAEKFVKNPFATEENGHGEIMYRTGDLARWREDGEIEYLGRMDTQVKIRGLRIELGEIESVMGEFPGIALCAVAAQTDEGGRQYLAGYYTAGESRGQQDAADGTPDAADVEVDGADGSVGHPAEAEARPVDVDEKALRDHLAKTLPRYMVPNYFVRLDEMPMTPSGKIDRKNLPAPKMGDVSETYIAPGTDTERKLAEIWQALLKVKRVGRRDDFFELGGDSLLALTLLNAVAETFGVEISVRDVTEQFTLERLAARIERVACGQDGCRHETAISPCRRDRYALLPQQKSIYAACRKEPGTLMYNMPARLELPGTIDRERLKQGIRTVMERHKILKTCIRQEPDDIYGIYDGQAEPVFEEYTQKTEKEFIRPFDLAKAPLFRVGFTENALLFDIHHIIADGGTVNIILSGIAQAYEGRKLPEPELWYGDYAEYFRTCDFTEHKKYFKEMLACDFEKVELPRTKEGKTGGASFVYRIPEHIMAKARAYARQNHLTDTMVFLGAYGILLSKYTAKREILTSVILQNRTHGETADMAGMFVNTLPVFLNVKGSTAAYFEQIKELTLNLFRYQELPFLEIADAVGMADKTAVNTSFVYQAGGEKKLGLEGASLLPWPMDTRTSKFDLSMEITPLERGAGLRLEYDGGKYGRGLMEELADSYVRILEQLEKETAAEDGGRQIAGLSVLPDKVRRKILYDFNDTYADYPRDKCVHELFAEQARRTPDKVALVFEEREFTYRQLDGMSNSLAHFLREQGVGRNDVVPIIARRSWHVVAAMLGVLKAGGAYLPVDPDYPAERIAYMLEEAGCRMALCYGYDSVLAVEAYDLTELDGICRRPECHSGEISCVNQPEDLCYVIYTSGTTGRPKGCCITHGNINNFCSLNEKNEYQTYMCGCGDRVLSVTSFIFDIFAFDVFLALLHGKTLVLSKHEYVKTGEELSNISVLQTTATKMEVMLGQFSGAVRSLQCVMAGAEVFTKGLYEKLRRATDAAVFNGYGPTETTIGAAFSRVVSPDITIGRPIANTQIYILDADSSPVPIGVAGELCIAGDGVGRGYLNRPELTAEKFVKNPFATEENGHGKTMYRTGDLARWREDGEIEYLGRMDTQVKIRGLRIELGEIESVMGEFPGIALCAVAAQTDEGGRQYLVGYYTDEESRGQQDTADGTPAAADRGVAGVDGSAARADREVAGADGSVEHPAEAEARPVDVDEKALRDHLAKTLPRYMVPNYFVRLDEMPMTPSGKIDRRNLPTPEITGREGEHIPPETGRERKLCRLLEELLGVDAMGVTDDFFDYGGDSLAAITYVARAHSAGIAFSLQDVFDHPTVRALCAHLDGEGEQREPFREEDFEKYRGLFAKNVPDEAWQPKKRGLGNVLLTGATGFLGAHVLDALLREETGKVYCLVRSGGRKTGVQPEAAGEKTTAGRLREALHYYFGSRYDEEIGRRIIPVEGDVEREGLLADGGTADSAMADNFMADNFKADSFKADSFKADSVMVDKVITDVQTVIHTAASVKHYGSYDDFYRANVRGTANAAAFAKEAGAAFVHVSTISVSGNSMADAFEVYRLDEERDFTEQDLFIGQPMDNVYVRSKFEAEMAVYDAMLRGLDAVVIRVGNLTNRQRDFKFQPNYQSNAFLTRVKVVLEFGLFPEYLLPLYAEFSPVDATAEGIVKIAQYADGQNVFHLNSNRPIYFDRFLEIVRGMGIPMKAVPGSKFHDALRRTLAEAGTEYIYEALQNDLDENGELAYDSDIHIINDFTVWFMERIGFEWDEIDEAYIRGYIEYFRGLGYLKV